MPRTVPRKLPWRSLAAASAIGFLCLSGGGCTKRSTAAVPGKVSGLVTVSAELGGKLKKTDVLYIIVRAQSSGPPTAVKRVVNPQLPLQFLIGPEDAMVPGAPGFEQNGKLMLTARLSRTGAAMPAAGDLEGAYKQNPARPGEGGLDIVIDHER